MCSCKNNTLKLFNFIRDILAKFGITNWRQSSDIGKNSDKGISDFRISGQSFINENCHNSRTSHDIDMKLEPVTKLDERNTAISVNCNFIVSFFIHGQFGTIRKPYSGRMIYKSYIFINSNSLSSKTWKQSLKISNTALILFALSKGIILGKKFWFFAKNADISKIKRAVVLKGIFSENTYECVLMYHISSL